MSRTTTSEEQELAERKERYRRLAARLREWLADESGYDEQVGPILADELAREPLRLRESDLSFENEPRS